MQESKALDLSAVSAFIALADCGSFAAAGVLLSRDATVVSRRVQGIEQRLGVRLVERSTRRVTLTEAGEAYLQQVRPLVAALAAAEGDIAALGSGEPRGHLRVSLPGSFGHLWLGAILVDFLQAHPRLSADVSISNRFVDLVGERYDVAIRLGELPDSRLVARRIGDRRRIVCAAPGYLAAHGPIDHPDDLARHACLAFSGRARPWHWEFKGTDGCRSAVDVTGPLASDDASLLVAAATAGLGVLYTTDWYVAREIGHGKLVPLMPRWSLDDPGGVYVVTPASAGTPNKTRALVDWLATRLADPPWAVSKPRHDEPTTG